MTVRCLLIACLLLAGCTPSEKPKEQSLSKQVNLYLQADPMSMDPRVAYERRSIQVTRELFEGLVRIGENGTPELALASSYTVSEDGKVYTFHLRPAKWSNGMPVTANDFVYAWRSTLDNSLPTSAAYVFFIIKNARKAHLGECPIEDVGVRAVDPSTLKITLEHAAPYFFEFLALTPFSPVCQAAVEKNPAWSGGVFPEYVCNGPFILKDRKMKSHLTLEKNPRYIGTKPAKSDRLNFFIIENPQAAYDMFQEGSLDWYGDTCGNMSLKTIRELSRRGALLKHFNGGVQWLMCNVNTPHLASAKIRKAIACSINRQEICDGLLQGGEIPAYSVVLRSMSQLREKPFDYNPVLARKLFEEGMAELGYMRETFPPITITHLSDPTTRASVEAEQQQIQDALGIRVELVPVNAGTYIKLVSSSDASQSTPPYQIVLTTWFNFYQDPMYALEYVKYRGQGINSTNWENPRYITLLDQADNTVDPQVRNAYLQQAEQLLMDELPIIPVFYHTFKYVKAPQLTGEAISGAGQVELRWLEKGSVG